MTPTVIVGPTVEPVSLTEARAWLSDPPETDNSLISVLITAAREYCEFKKSVTFYEQTLEVALPYWPCYGRIVLPRATPLISIESFKATDSDGVESTVSSSLYRLDTRSTPGAILLRSGSSWPSVDVDAPNPVVIQYVAGTQVTSPETPIASSVRLAMQMLIAHWFRNREAVVVGQSAGVAASDLPRGVDDLLSINQQIFAF